METSEWLPVKLYTQCQAITGVVYHPQEDRLLDILSSTSVKRLENRGRFLELRDVRVQNADGKEESLEDAFINKESIHLAATFDADSARGIGAKIGTKPYPYTQKVVSRVIIRTSAYNISGNIYCANYQNVWQLLEDMPSFLPLTSAAILSQVSKAKWEAPFVAVNKEQIISLEEPEHKKSISNKEAL